MNIRNSFMLIICPIRFKWSLQGCGLSLVKEQMTGKLIHSELEIFERIIILPQLGQSDAGIVDYGYPLCGQEYRGDSIVFGYRHSIPKPLGSFTVPPMCIGADIKAALDRVLLLMECRTLCQSDRMEPVAGCRGGFNAWWSLPVRSPISVLKMEMGIQKRVSS